MYPPRVLKQFSLLMFEQYKITPPVLDQLTNKFNLYTFTCLPSHIVFYQIILLLFLVLCRLIYPVQFKRIISISLCGESCDVVSITHDLLKLWFVNSNLIMYHSFPRTKY